MIERFSVLPYMDHSPVSALPREAKKNTLSKNTHFQTKVWRSSPNEPEWRADVYLYDNVPGIIRRGVKHPVEREAGIVNNVVQLSVFPAKDTNKVVSISGLIADVQGTEQKKYLLNTGTYLMVASRIF